MRQFIEFCVRGREKIALVETNMIQDEKLSNVRFSGLHVI